MSDANLRQIRVLHIVSGGALANSLQQSLFMPLLTRLPRPRVKSLVACLSPGAVPSAVLRQSGVPTYDLAISRNRFSPRALQELQQATHNFRPDVIQAWGHTAQIISAFLRPRCEWKPRLIWSIADTIPLAKNAGLIDRQKLKYAAKFAGRADRVVYSSEAAASQHRRVGFPEGEHETIPPGVDATRFKPDFAARRKLREQLSLPGEAFVIGMYAPFQPEYDHATLIKAIGELIKINPNIAVVLAGHGVQKGNAPLMALVGGGALATRVHLLGEWSDISSLYNACDVVCSSALNDQSRMNVVMAMLCGVPCVATGLGAQGEVIAQHGVAIEAGSPTAFVKGITRVMQMTPEKRTFMAQGARKHALANYVYVRSLQKYLQLYYDLIGRQSLVTQDLPTPEVDAMLTVPPALPTEAELNAARRKPPTVDDLSDPDSLESKVAERQAEELPKWRIEQEQERSKREADLAAKVAASQISGDVLQVFEVENPATSTSATPMTERARGVADDVEELLSPELLATEAPSQPRVSNAPSGARKATSASQASVAPQPDSAKQAALKAAQRAALQPIAPSPKRAATAKPSAKPAAVVEPVAQSAFPSIDFNSTQPLELLPQSELLQAPVRAAAPVTAAPSVTATAEKIDDSVMLTKNDPPSQTLTAPAQAASAVEKIDSSGTQPLAALPEIDLFPTQSAATPAEAPPHDAKIDSTIQPSGALAASAPAKIDGSATQALEMLPDIDFSLQALAAAPVPAAASVAEKVDGDAVPTMNVLPEIDLSLVMGTPAQPSQAAAASQKIDIGLSPAVPTQSAAVSQTIDREISPPAPTQATVAAPKIDSAASALGRLAKALAAATIPPVSASADATTIAVSPVPSERAGVESTPVSGNMQTAAALSAVTSDATSASPPSVAAKSSVAHSADSTSATPGPTSSMTAVLDKWNSSFDLGELSLMATGAWAATPRSGTKPDAEAPKSDELSGLDALSLISQPATSTEVNASGDKPLQLETLPDPPVEPKRAVNGHS